MEIIRKSCAKGALEVEGLTVVIDVFRAFSCEPLFFHFKAERVILEADPVEAVLLKEKNRGYILVGEVDEVPIEGADLGNSPSQIILKGESYFKGKTVVHRTTAGVTGTATALERADDVILGSFVMARAIAGYIKKTAPDKVTLLAMGHRAKEKSPEDEACADYLEHLLTGKPHDPVALFRDVVFQPTAQRFIKGVKPYLPREDPLFCLQKDLFDFVLRAVKAGERIEVEQIPSR